MANLEVTVNKLNRRRSPVADFADKSNVVEVVSKGFTFESVAQIENSLGVWHQDRDGWWAWEKGVSESRETFKWFQDLGIEEIWSSFNELGENSLVAILDTGYDTINQDFPAPLSNKMFVNNAANTATIQDKLGHGTTCLSLIATKNQKLRLGIAPRSKILVGKVSLKGELRNIDIILDGIEWAIGLGADIISISLGLPLTDQLIINQLQKRLNQIVAGKNVLIFSACGDSDSGQVITKEFYPASFDNCMSVGTVKNSLLDNITVRSNKTIIHTLGIDVEAYVLDNRIEKQSGTSLSVPIVAGILALAVSIIKKKNNGKWDKDVLLQNIIATGDPINGFPKKRIINPFKLFKSI